MCNILEPPPGKAEPQFGIKKEDWRVNQYGDMEEAGKE